MTASSRPTVGARVWSRQSAATAGTAEPVLPIPWSSELSVGHRLIDQDHQTLVELVNELYRLDRAGDSAEVGVVLGQLLDHTAWHFHREEVLMMARGYPETRRHRQEHAAVLAQLQTLYNRYQDGDPVAVETIADSVARWFLGHATTHDRLLGRFLRREG